MFRAKSQDGRVGPSRTSPWQLFLFRGWQGEVERAALAGSDSTHIFPPWRSTIFLQKASPRPLPATATTQLKAARFIVSLWISLELATSSTPSIPAPKSAVEM